MASYAISVDKVKAFVKAQYLNEEKYAHNMKLLRALGMFAGSVALFRSYGDMMAV